jgi:hypothetical protein
MLRTGRSNNWCRTIACKARNCRFYCGNCRPKQRPTWLARRRLCAAGKGAAGPAAIFPPGRHPQGLFGYYVDRIWLGQCVGANQPCPNRLPACRCPDARRRPTATPTMRRSTALWSSMHPTRSGISMCLTWTNHADAPVGSRQLAATANGGCCWYGCSPRHYRQENCRVMVRDSGPGIAQIGVSRAGNPFPQTALNRSQPHQS